MRVMLRCFIISVFLLLLSSIVKSQTFTSEADMKKHVRKLFDNKEYVNAAPYFSQLLSLYPKDPEYNFKYGTCLLFSDHDKEKAIKFLEFASTKEGVDPEVFFYLGKAFHLDYRFEKAITAYKTFIEKGTSKSKADLQPERQIEMCKNGKTLIRNITELIVMDKKEIKQMDFFRSYDLDDFGGKIIVKPDDFKTPFDIKQGEKSVMFLPNNPDKIFFASYGENNKNGKDIYNVIKLDNGEWSKPKALGLKINTPFDEDYPFMHPNGKTLYFCSKGHNSMGGYDIFKSEYDKDNDSWSTPVNLDFAISSPDDDMLFITDKEEKLAYFSSSRASIEGYITVYKINIESKPEEYILVNGKFFTEIKDVSKSVTIKVYRISDNKLIGNFSSQSDGSYVLKIPNGGRFKFLVEAARHPVQSGIVEVPFQKDPKMLKQEMELVRNETGVKLTIRNLFDEEIKESEQLLALDIIKLQAKLEVNYNPDLAIRYEEKEAHKVNEIKKSQGNTTNQVKENNPSVSNSDITKIAFQDAEVLKNEAEEFRKEADFAFAFAEKKSIQADEKQKESEKAKKEALANQDMAQRKTGLDKAEELKKASVSLTNQASVALKIAEKSDNDAKRKKEESEIALQYAKELDSAVNSTSSKEALDKLKTQKTNLENSANGNGAKDILSQTRNEQKEKNKQAERARKEATESKTEADEIKTEIQNLEKVIEKTKDKKGKASLSEQLSTLKEDHQEAETKANANNEKALMLEKEVTSLNNEAGLIEKMITEISLKGNQTLSMDKNQIKQIKERIDEQKISAANEPNKNSFSENNTLTENNKSKEVQQSKLTIEETPGINSEKQNKFNGIVNNKGEIVDYGADFKKQLEENTNKPNGVEKAKTNARITNQWAESINDEINLRTEKIKSLNASEQKQEEKRIAELEKELIVKKSEAKKLQEASTALEKIESEQVIANKKEQTENVEPTSEASKKHFEGVAPFAERVEIPNQQGEISDYSNTYIDQLDKTETLGDDFNKERTKAEIYSNWSSTMRQEMLIREENIKNLKGKEKKAEQIKIDQLANSAISKQIEADEFLAKAELLQKNREQEKALSSSKKIVNSNDNPEKEEKNTKIENPEVNEIFEEEINYSNEDEQAEVKKENNPKKKELPSENLSADNQNKEKTNIEENQDARIKANNSVLKNNYSSTSAKESLKKATSVMDEANNLSVQADAIRSGVASISDPDEKTAQLKRASELDKQAQMKKSEAALALSDAGKTEFNVNKINIEKNFNPSKEGQETAVATMLLEEADYYIKQAEQTRQKALSNENPASRFNFLTQAIEMEKTAIEKQVKAMEILNIKPDASLAALALTEKNNPIQTEEDANKIKVLNAESESEFQKAEELEQEAKELEKDAQYLSEKAENTKKKKEKEVLVEQATEKSKEAKVLKDEARFTFEKAEKLKEQAASINLSNSKTNSLNNENTFKEKENALNNELAASTKKENLREEKSLQQENEIELKKEEIKKENEAKNESSNAVKKETQQINQEPVRENLNAIKSKIEEQNQKGIQFTEQAQILEKEAQVLALEAEQSKKKKEKAELLQKSNEKTEQANIKKANAGRAFENVRNLEKDAALVKEYNEQTNNTSNKEKETPQSSIQKKEEYRQQTNSLKKKTEEESNNAKQYSEQAQELEKEAEALELNAQKSKKKKEKEEFKQKSIDKTEQANSKKELAENAMDNVRELEKEMALLKKNNPEENGTANRVNSKSLVQNQEEYNKNTRILEGKIAEENKKATLFTEKAQELKKEAEALALNAQQSKKKKEKEEFQQKSIDKTEQANSKTELAENAMDNVRELENEMVLLKKNTPEENGTANRANSKSLVQNQEEYNENTRVLEGKIAEENKKATLFTEQAQELEKEAQAMALNAEQSKKKKEKEELTQKSIEKAEQANSKKVQAENAFDKVRALEKDLVLLKTNKTKENASIKNGNEHSNSPIQQQEEYKQRTIVLKNQIVEENKKASQLTEQAQELEKEAEVLALNAQEIKKKKEKLELQQKSSEKTEQANSKKEQAKNVLTHVKILENEAAEIVVLSEKINQDEKEKEEKKIATEALIAKSSMPSDINKYEVPKILTEEIFDKAAPTVYNAKNPIPVDAGFPEGLVFKVQVGAFRNPIPYDLFKGFAPIMGETTPQGFTRYTAGMFKALATANLAKDVIRGNGYPDAFVVVFYNGKRISMNEAQALINSGKINDNNALAAGNSKTNSETTLNKNESLNNSPLNQQEKNEISKTDVFAKQEKTFPQDVAPYHELNAVKGLLYTVQVGVYTRPVPPGQLFNIQPLYVEKTSNGMLRYTSGIFNNTTRANEAKNTVVSIGVKDAFVSAYYNGARISVAEARKIEELNGSSVFIQSNTMNVLPGVSNDNAVFVGPIVNKTVQDERPSKITKAKDQESLVEPKVYNQVINNQEELPKEQKEQISNPIKENNPVSDSNEIKPKNNASLPENNEFEKLQLDKKTLPGLEYKVQIGAFKDEVPLEIATVFFKLSYLGISHYINDQGLTVYSIGNYFDYSTASSLKRKIAQDYNLKDAFIVPYLNKEKISTNQALELLKK